LVTESNPLHILNSKRRGGETINEHRYEKWWRIVWNAPITDEQKLEVVSRLCKDGNNKMCIITKRVVRYVLIPEHTEESLEISDEVFEYLTGVQGTPWKLEKKSCDVPIYDFYGFEKFIDTCVSFYDTSLLSCAFDMSAVVHTENKISDELVDQLFEKHSVEVSKMFGWIKNYLDKELREDRLDAKELVFNPPGSEYCGIGYTPPRMSYTCAVPAPLDPELEETGSENL